MCFHNSMNKKLKELAARYGRTTDIVEAAEEILAEQYHIAAFSNPDYPIITDEKNIQDYKWGLIPFWSKTAKDAETIRKMTYNARSETIFTLPSFRTPIRHKRCIIPSTGYFEWHHNDGKSTTPYFIYVKNQEIFSMGGVYDIWLHPDTGEEIYTFALITTPANELTYNIHNGGKNPHRMPLILLPEEEEKWLDPKLDAKSVEAMLKPFPAKEMDAYPVYNNFIKKSPKDSSILDAVESLL